MIKKQTRKKKRHTRYKKHGGTPKLQRLNASRKNVDSILERIKKNQDASRANMQKMFRYIKGESLPQYDLGQAKSGSPVYDLGRAKSGSPVYDLGQAEPVYDLGQAKSGSPVYDIGQAKSGSPVYDLGQAEPVYDLGQANSETFKLIVKRTLDKNNIYTRDDLIKFCNGSNRTKIYDAVLKDCPPNRCDGKHFKSHVRDSYEKLLPGFKIYKVSKVSKVSKV